MEQDVKKLRVYKKQSTFKGATKDDFWYSGTRSDGVSVTCVFKCPIPTESKAFDIAYIVGNAKEKKVLVKGEEYVNVTYYITSCEFYEIAGEELSV